MTQGDLASDQTPYGDVAWRNDGAVFATRAEGPTIRFWDAHRGVLLGEDTVSAFQIAFDPAGDLLAYDFSGARRYPCEICGSFDDLLALARSRVSRELTAAERRTYLGE